MNRLVLLVLAALVLTTAGGTYGKDPDFSSWWHDGKAEMDGYRLTVTRYGQEREGQCVMIFVTEPFSESRRVKVDDPRGDPGDTDGHVRLLAGAVMEAQPLADLGELVPELTAGGAHEEVVLDRPRRLGVDLAVQVGLDVRSHIWVIEVPPVGRGPDDRTGRVKVQRVAIHFATKTSVPHVVTIA